MTIDSLILGRPAFIGGGAALAAAAELQPGWARTASSGVAAKGQTALSGEEILLTIAKARFQLDGRIGSAVAVNGTIAAPLIRLREGQNVRLTVENQRWVSRGSDALPAFAAGRSLCRR